MWIAALVALFAGAGFHQTYGWDLVMTVGMMTILLVVPGVLMDHLVTPTADAFLETTKGTLIFFGLHALFAFHIYVNGDTPFHDKIEESYIRYCTIWWSTFPCACAFAVLLDRIFKWQGVYRDKSLPDSDASVMMPELNRASKGPTIEADDNVIEFDPKRFH